MSTSTFAPPLASSRLALGSSIIPASMRPWSIAAIKVSSDPTGNTVYSFGDNPARAAR